MSDIILVYPRTGMDIGSTIAPPHNLLCVAAPLDKAGYKVRIIDQRVDKQWRLHLLEELRTSPVFVGISTMTGTQVGHAVNAARFVRAHSNTPIVWGGPHPSLLPEQVLESGLADHVCVGEVDETIVQTVQDIANGRAPKIIKSPLPDVENLLPTPWHLIDVEKYVHSDVYLKKGRHLDVGQTSRGCPFMCGFCSSASIRERKWRAMSSDKALDMIGRAIVDFDLSGFWLRDDEFYISQSRAAKIAEGLIPLGVRWYTSGTRVDVFNKTPDDQVALYRRAGAGTLKFGAESGNNRVLKLIGKGITREDTLEANLKCKRHGITPAFAFMMGFLTETLDEIGNTIDLARQLREDNPRAQFETFAPYLALPGTPMWQDALDRELRPPTKLEDWSSWIVDEYDDEGSKLPWYNAQERQALGNLCYLSMLSNAVPNVLDSLNGTGKLLKLAYAIPHKYFQYRFFHKKYTHMPEMRLVRWLRRKVFYGR